MTLRVGLVGCGEWGRHVLRDLLAIGCEVHVVARSEESRRRARDGGAAGIVGTVEALPDVTAAVVVTPTATHAEVIERLLDRPIPVFCEKPLTADLPAAERLAARAADRLFVMDKWRYHPGVEALGAIARSGELGPVVGLRTTRVGWTHSQPDVDSAWHLVPHDLSIALEVLGRIPEPRAAVAEREGTQIVGLLGILGTAPWVAFEASSRRARSFREVRLFCAGGAATLSDSYSDHLSIRRAAPASGGPPEPERRAISTELPLLRELRAFVEHVKGGPPPKSNAADGLEIVRAIDRLRALASL